MVGVKGPLLGNHVLIRGPVFVDSGYGRALCMYPSKALACGFGAHWFSINF